LISATFNLQLLRAQIPKAQKGIDELTVFFQFWDLSTLNLCVNMLVKSTPSLQKGNVNSVSEYDTTSLVTTENNIFFILEFQICV